MGVIFIRRIARFQILSPGVLGSQEREAVDAALREQEQSINKKFQVGAAAVSYDGTMVAVRNDRQGPDWHGEQRAVSTLYAKTKDKRLKLIAMAGARPGESVIDPEMKSYRKGVKVEHACWAKPCGKCLEFIHDCTANVPDVKFLSVMQTGQIVRTSLYSLITAPHTSLRVPVEHIGGDTPEGMWFPVPSTTENKNDPYG